MRSRTLRIYRGLSFNKFNIMKIWEKYRLEFLRKQLQAKADNYAAKNLRTLKRVKEARIIDQKRRANAFLIQSIRSNEVATWTMKDFE